MTNVNLDRLKEAIANSETIDEPLVKVVEPEIRTVAKYALLGTPAKTGGAEGKPNK